MKTRVFIVDDHEIVITGLSAVINSQEDMVVCGTAKSYPEALEKIEEIPVHVVLVDINLKKRSGLELISQIKRIFPKINFLAFSMYDESLYAPKAIAAGAKGYIMKTEDSEKIIDAIRTVAKGEIYLSAELKSFETETDTLNSINLLSVRELEIFRSFGQGNSTRQVAETLKISPKTVQTYKDRIRKKLNLKSSNEIASTAAKWLQL